MKSHFFHTLLFLIGFVSILGDKSQAQRSWVDSPKKGSAYSLSVANQANNLEFLHEIAPEWFYSWGAEPLTGFESLPNGIDFVPMAWGRGGLTDPSPNRIDMWNEGAQNGLYDTLLGFNEPDLASQSNISVEEALQLWPLLESTGLRLGSPAAANANGSWFIDFMTQAEALQLRVDFVAMHRYAGPNAQGFLDHVQLIHNIFGKPIWITEFAVRDGLAMAPEENRWADEEVYEFMAEVLPGLEAMDFVERYSWFAPTRENAFLTSSALHELDGQLTRLGRLYQGKVQFLNPGFEAVDAVNSDSPRDWFTLFNTSVNESDSHSGKFSLSLAPAIPAGQSQPGIVRQELFPGKDIDLGCSYSMAGWIYNPSKDPLTGNREVTFRIQWHDEGNNIIHVESKVVATSSTPMDQWLLVKLEDVFVPNLPEIAEVRVSVFNNNVGPSSMNSGVIYLDDMVFNKGPQVIVGGIVGDVNQDGLINLLDVDPFIGLLGSADYQFEADTNGDGQLNLLDVSPFIDLLSSS